jgi:antitoxin component of RelBE/YafQ-DinJ toxin-antitoxin module
MEIGIEEKIRMQACEIFEKMGITEEEAVILFYKRVIACGRMPFGQTESRKQDKRKKTRMNERFAEWDAF